MAWAIQTWDLHSIRSYQDAVEHWERTPPWKNETTDKRALAGWRKHHMHLRKIGDAYECVLYHTPIATYYPDGSIQVDTCDTQSTIAFGRCMTPMGIDAISHMGCMYWRIQEADTQRYYRGRSLLIPADTPDVWINNSAGSKKPELEWVLDRKKAAEVRKLFKPYAEWHKLTARLMNKTHYPSAVYNHNILRRLMEYPTDHELYPECMRLIGDVPNFLTEAYSIARARSKQEVPFDRLPRRER